MSSDSHTDTLGSGAPLLPVGHSKSTRVICHIDPGVKSDYSVGRQTDILWADLFTFRDVALSNHREKIAGALLGEQSDDRCWPAPGTQILDKHLGFRTVEPEIEIVSSVVGFVGWSPIETVDQRSVDCIRVET